MVHTGSAAFATGGDGAATTLSSEMPNVKTTDMATSRGEGDLPGLSRSSSMLHPHEKGAPHRPRGDSGLEFLCVRQTPPPGKRKAVVVYAPESFDIHPRSDQRARFRPECETRAKRVDRPDEGPKGHLARGTAVQLLRWTTDGCASVAQPAVGAAPPSSSG